MWGLGRIEHRWRGHHLADAKRHLNSAGCGTRHVPTRSDGVADLGGLFLLGGVGGTLPLRHLHGLQAECLLLPERFPMPEYTWFEPKR